VAALVQGANANAEALQLLHTEVTGLHTEVEGCKGGLAHLKESVARMEQRMDKMAKQLSDVEGAFWNASKRVGALAANCDAVQHEVGELRTEVREVRVEMRTGFATLSEQLAQMMAMMQGQQVCSQPHSPVQLAASVQSHHSV
jgi:predicted  nucleic acid-binding Zn-ribbon protein